MALSDAQWILANPASYSAQAQWNAAQELGQDVGPRPLETGPEEYLREIERGFQTPESQLISSLGGFGMDQVGAPISGKDYGGWTAPSPDGGGGGGGGGTYDWRKTATRPWGGTIQFDPGGIVYKVPEGMDPKWMAANQDWLINKGYAMTPQQFGQHMGIDIYEPGYVPGSYYPSEDQYIDKDAFSPRAWEAVDQGPARQNFRTAVAKEQRDRQQQKQIDNLYDYFGLGGGVGGSFGGGGAYNPYNPYDPYDPYGTGGGIPPVTETSTYPTTPPFTGEPSFAKDTDLSDPFLNIREVGLGAFPTQTMRDRLGTWLTKEMGYDPQGVYGSYGEQEYERPSGTTGPIWFNPSDFASIVDPQIQSWIKWLMGRMGYAATANYPGAAAP